MLSTYIKIGILSVCIMIALGCNVSPTPLPPTQVEIDPAKIVVEPLELNQFAIKGEPESVTPESQLKVWNFSNERFSKQDTLVAEDGSFSTIIDGMPGDHIRLHGEYEEAKDNAIDFLAPTEKGPPLPIEHESCIMIERPYVFFGEVPINEVRFEMISISKTCEDAELFVGEIRPGGPAFHPDGPFIFSAPRLPLDLQKKAVYQIGVMYTPREYGMVDVGNLFIVVTGPNFSHPDEFIVTFEAVTMAENQQP